MTVFLNMLNIPYRPAFLSPGCIISQRLVAASLCEPFSCSWRAVNHPTRLPISSVHKALQMSGIDVAVEEAECIIANMIYRGYVKGYISHEKQMVVLAAKDPFPSLALRSA